MFSNAAAELTLIFLAALPTPLATLVLLVQFAIMLYHLPTARASGVAFGVLRCAELCCVLLVAVGALVAAVRRCWCCYWCHHLWHSNMKRRTKENQL